MSHCRKAEFASASTDEKLRLTGSGKGCSPSPIQITTVKPSARFYDDDRNQAYYQTILGDNTVLRRALVLDSRLQPTVDFRAELGRFFRQEVSHL